MTTFKYTGLTVGGAKVSGIVEAYDEYEAVASLRDRVPVITEISAVSEAAPSLLNMEIGGSGKIKLKELAMMCSQFSIILSSGMPLMRCVRMVASQTQDKKMRAMLEKVAQDIEAGYSMTASFENNGENLPVTFIETIRAGEASGTLENCFKRLFRYYDKSAKTKSQVVSALTYPALVIFVAIVVFIIIMTVAVPLFTKSFLEMGVELPFITKAMMAVSDFFVNFWWVILLAAAVFIAGYLVARRSEEWKKALSKFALEKAPLHKIRSMSCSATFADTMATMLSAGLQTNRALEVTAGIITNDEFRDGVDRVRLNVEQGGGIASGMEAQCCFPDILIQMTGVGEEGGTLTETLEVVADYYNNEVEVATGRLLSLMEPVITVGLAVLTVFLLLGVYLPMFSMYGSIG